MSNKAAKKRILRESLPRTPSGISGLDPILAIPTLVRSIPAPLKRIIGDLSNVEKALVGLNLRATKGSETQS